MKKSVYSLILSDSVIEAIDRLAYTQGISRSAMVNEILAKTVSYTTPEMQIRQIVGRVGQQLTETEFIPIVTSGNTIAVRSRLIYKYNPSLRYTIEFLKGTFPKIGILKIGIRTRSEQPMLLLLQFFRLWKSLEEEFRPDIVYRIREDKIERDLIPQIPEGHPIDTEIIGDSMVRYINLLNRAIGIYFSMSCDNSAVKSTLWELCRHYYLTEIVSV